MNDMCAEDEAEAYAEHCKKDKQHREANNRIMLYSREFNALVEVGVLESAYIINVDIDAEKDSYVAKIKRLENREKKLKEVLNATKNMSDFGTRTRWYHRRSKVLEELYPDDNRIVQRG